LHDTPCTSIEVVKRLMNREMPVVPDIYMSVCDVRDVATAHVVALTLPEAVSNRHIIVSTFEASSFREWALILDEEFRSKNYNVPTTAAPNALLKFVSFFDKSLRQVKMIKYKQRH
jgi:nucleoside-diphosphate-sugar epimerase